MTRQEKEEWTVVAAQLPDRLRQKELKRLRMIVDQLNTDPFEIYENLSLRKIAN